MALPAFPNPVNEVSARLVAGGVVAMAAATVAFDLEWMTLLLAYGFVARVLAGPRFSPLALVVTRVITPSLPVEGRLVPGPPKRFAQLLGAIFTVTAALLTLAGRFDLAQWVLAVLLVPASLEAFAGFCVGCWMFNRLMQLGVIPESVCADCADISRRLGAPA
jgi:hypothetical protein